MADATTFSVDSLPLIVATSVGQASGPYPLEVSTGGQVRIQNQLVSAIAVSGNGTVSGTFIVAGQATFQSGITVSAISSLDGAVAVGGALAVTGITSLNGASFTAGQLTAQASVNFIPAAGKVMFQTTVFASANVSAGLWIECLTSGGTKIYIPARTAVP